MRLQKIFLAAVSAVVLMSSCTKKLDELLVNPNAPGLDKADAGLYLNTVQLNYSGVINSANSYGSSLVRQVVMYGPTYRNAFTPVSFDGIWNTAYTGVFKHVDAVIPIAAAQNRWVDVAMAKIMRAHTMMIMVDLFGDVPLTEANKGIENTNPAVEKGNAVYAKAIALLDEAIADVGKSPVVYPGSRDLFFAANSATGVARWRTAAKLLKLRALSTTRLVANNKDAINALIADADVVASTGTTASDYEFKYGTRQANPDNRHPAYASNYQPTGSSSDYIGTQFMYSLAVEKGSGDANNDPRTRYYLYRQRINYADRNENSMSCSVSTPPAHYPSGMPFCFLITGFWGRDHGDNSGIPPDGPFRTTWGIYPAGGEFDANQGSSVSLVRGGQGAGILPIWQSAFTEFVKAECALTIGTNGDARALLEAGIRRSMAKVAGFPASIGAAAVVPANFAMASDRVDNYVNKVLAQYNAATNNDQRLSIIGKEYWLALWGNGMEAYNLYRRTGKPAGMQLPRLTDPGVFVRSMFYPATYVNLNKNAVQKTEVNVQVFWDNNPAGFIK